MEKFLTGVLDLLKALYGLLNDSINKNSRFKTKYQTVEVVKANALAAGRYSDSIELDSNYEYCDGVQVIEITAGGIPTYAIGLEDKNNTYHNITNKKDWASGSDTPINQRYKDIHIPVINGEKLEIKTEFAVVLAAELKYEIIFRLRKRK